MGTNDVSFSMELVVFHFASYEKFWQLKYFRVHVLSRAKHTLHYTFPDFIRQVLFGLSDDLKSTSDPFLAFRITSPLIDRDVYMLPMSLCTTAVTPLLTNWGCHSIALLGH